MVLEDLKDLDNRLPIAKYGALMKASKKLCNDPALCYWGGKRIHEAAGRQRAPSV